MHLPPQRRAELIDAAKFDLNDDGRLNRLEFVQLCVSEMWHVPLAVLERAAQNMKDAKMGHQRRAAAYWRALATRTDSWSRVAVPCLYVLSLLVLFNLELSDEYQQPNTPMFDGLGPAAINERGVVALVAYTGILVFFLVAWALMRRVGSRRAEKGAVRKKELFRKTVSDLAAVLPRLHMVTDVSTPLESPRSPAAKSPSVRGNKTHARSTRRAARRSQGRAPWDLDEADYNASRDADDDVIAASPPQAAV